MDNAPAAERDPAVMLTMAYYHLLFLPGFATDGPTQDALAIIRNASRSM